MVLTAKREFFKHAIYDEAGNLLVRIRHKMGGYDIEDASKTKILQVGEQGDGALVFDGKSVSGHADIKLKERTNRLLMPRADRVALHLAENTYEISQSEQRNFPILCNGKPFVKISHMLGRKMKIETQEMPNIELLALLFVSSIIMLHEDDEILV